VPGVWLAALLPVVLIAVAVGLEGLERHLSGPPHLDPKHATDRSSAEVPRPASGRQLRTVRIPSRLGLVMASCVVLVAAGVTALVVGRSAPAPVPIPLFTEVPPAAVVSPPPVVDDLIPTGAVPAVAQLAAPPAAVAHVVTLPSSTKTRTTTQPTTGPQAVLSSRPSASDNVRDRTRPSASNSGKSQAKRAHGGGSSTSQRKGNAKGNKSKSSHGNKDGHKG
jgi:hypothetical protein